MCSSRRPGCVARLAEERRLLVARDPRDWHLAAKVRWSCRSSPAEGSAPGSASGSTPSSSHSSWSQLQLADVEEQRSRSVRDVGGVTAGQLVDEPRVDRAENGVAGSASTFRRSHSILVPEKYGSRTSPVRSRTRSSCPASRSSSQRACRAAVLPDERAVNRLAGLRIPCDDRLALVSYSDRVEGLALRPGVLERATAATPMRSSPRSRSRRALPSLAAGNAARTPSTPGP